MELLSSTLASDLANGRFLEVDVNEQLALLEADGYSIPESFGRSLICYKDVGAIQRHALALGLEPLTVGENLDDPAVLKDVVVSNGWIITAHDSFSCSLNSLETCMNEDHLVQLFPPAMLSIFCHHIAKIKQEMETRIRGERDHLLLSVRRQATINMINVINEMPDEPTYSVRLAQCMMRLEARTWRILFFSFGTRETELRIATIHLLVPADKL